MIVYDNSSQFWILFQLKGSVLPRCLPIGIATLIVGTTLAILREYNLTDDVFSDTEYIEDPFAMRLFSLVVGYLVVVRSNVALGRWMAGISEIQVMVAKWTEAFNDINGFLAGKIGTPEESERVRFFRIRVAHYFCLMSCLAMAKLRAGIHQVELVDVPIKAKYPLVKFPSKKKRKQSFAPCLTDVSSFDEDSDGFGHHEVHTLDLIVLHLPTPEEVRLLDASSEKVKTTCLWIAQLIMMEIRSGTLDAPPPIATRIFSELTDGMLAYQQAVKIAHVPFPFPFAQAVGLLLWMLYVCIPFYVDCFTQNVVLTPIISFVLPMCYCGLNQISVELEEPFGTDWNDANIQERHEAFVHWIVTVLKQPAEPPVTHKDLEDEILGGFDKLSAETGHVPWFANREPSEDSFNPDVTPADEHSAQPPQRPGVLDLFQSLFGMSSCFAGEPRTSPRSEQVVERIPDEFPQ